MKRAVPGGRPWSRAPGPATLGFVGISHGYTPRRRVISDLTWRLGQGRTLLLGPNGAGKSTLLRLGAGLARPRSGAVEGCDPVRVGYMAQHIRPVPGLSCVEQVAYAAWLKGVGSRRARADAAAALGEVGLADLAGRASTALSGGQLRRLGVAQTLVGDPAVLLLDEPLAALDPAQREGLTMLLSRLGMPMLIATHQTEGLAGLCDRVAVMHGGAIVADLPAAGFLALGGSGEGAAVRAYRAILQGAGAEAGL